MGWESRLSYFSTPVDGKKKVVIVGPAGVRPRLDEAMVFASYAPVWEQIGDCVQASNVRNAVRSGYDAANRI